MCFLIALFKWVYICLYVWLLHGKAHLEAIVMEVLESISITMVITVYIGTVAQQGVLLTLVYYHGKHFEPRFKKWLPLYCTIQCIKYLIAFLIKTM